MSRLVIIGAGGFGREVLMWARQGKPAFDVKGFLDDHLGALDFFGRDVPVLSTIDDYKPAPEDVFVCAIGQVTAKKSCIQRILAKGGVFTNVVHETVVMGENVVLGRGIILCPHAVISPDVRLGDFTTVNLHSTVAHDAVIGQWSQLHCHVDVTGNVILGESVLVGSHASILPGIRVGDGAIVGAGSVVTRNVAPWVTVTGSPARAIMRRDSSRA